MATHFYGVMCMMRSVLPVMRKQRSGWISNHSSLAGIVGFKHCGACSAAKFAVEGLSASAAHEVEPFEIKIVAVEPGFFRRYQVTSELVWNQETPRSRAAGPRIEIKIDRIIQKSGDISQKAA